MKCRDCVYYYKNQDDDFMTCHCNEPEGFSPCEQEDDDDDEYEDPYGDDSYDYYEGI